MASKRNVKELPGEVKEPSQSVAASALESLKESFKWPRALPLIVTAIAILLLLYLLIEASNRLSFVIEPVFVPLLISLALAYLLEPVVEQFEKRRLSRSTSTVLTMLLAVFVLALALLYLVPSFWSQLSDLIANLPDKVRAAGTFIQTRLAYLQSRNPQLYGRISDQISQFVQDPKGVTEPIGNFIKNGIQQVGGITASILNLILIPLFLYY